MPGAAASAAFFGVAVLLALAPGPDNLFVLMQSALQGARGGLAVVFGLCTGLLFHTAAVALGLAAVFAASPLAFTTLKVAGALYLAWLAWQAFTASSDLPGGSASSLSGWALYRRGIVMNVTNPKVTIFFLAFLPQFIALEAGPVALQVVWFGLLFMVATFLVFGAVALCAGALGERLRRSSRLRVVLNRLAGVVFLALAARLVAERA